MKQRRRTWATVAALAAVSLATATGQKILDRTVAVVGDRAITASEVEEQIALEELDADGLTDRSPVRYREVVERLIRLRLVQREIELTGFAGATDEQVEQQMENLRREFGGAAQLRQALADHGLSDAILKDFLRQQLDFALFVDFRFRTGLVIPPEEVEAYYNSEYRPSLPASVTPPPLDQVYDHLESEIVERRVDPLLNDWINRMRSQTRITVVDRESVSAEVSSP